MKIEEMTALTISTARKPKRLRIGSAVNFIDMAPAAEAKVRRPEANGAETEADLEQQRQEERRRADADAEDDAADDARPEGRQRQQAQVEHRVRDAPRVPCIERSRTRTR